MQIYPNKRFFFVISLILACFVGSFLDTTALPDSSSQSTTPAGADQRTKSKQKQPSPRRLDAPITVPQSKDRLPLKISSPVIADVTSSGTSQTISTPQDSPRSRIERKKPSSKRPKTPNLTTPLTDKPPSVEKDNDSKLVKLRRPDMLEECIDPIQYFSLTVRKKREDIGVRIDSALRMVAANGGWLKKVLLNDIVVAVDGIAIMSQDHFYELTFNAIKGTEILIYRPILAMRPTEKHLNFVGVTSDYRKQNGKDIFFVVRLIYQPEIDFVTVKTTFSPPCCINRRLQIGDLILDVDGMVVRSAPQAEMVISKAFMAKGFCNLLIQRAGEKSTFQLIRDIVKEKLGQQRTNPILPSESILFGTRGLIQHRKTIGNPLANILAIGLRSGKASKVQVDESDIRTHIVESDLLKTEASLPSVPSSLSNSSEESLPGTPRSKASEEGFNKFVDDILRNSSTVRKKKSSNESTNSRSSQPQKSNSKEGSTMEK